jgi:hypothetical protein
MPKAQLMLLTLTSGRLKLANWISYFCGYTVQYSPVFLTWLPPSLLSFPRAGGGYCVGSDTMYSLFCIKILEHLKSSYNMSGRILSVDYSKLPDTK